jgi:hypothetical protein
VAYAEGLGIRKNPAAAVRWYEKAAGQGNSLAAYALGVILYDGADGVAINRPEATRLLTQAAEAGVEQARKVLAFIQENSQSPRISADEALGNQLEESTRRLEKEQQERRCANMQAWGDSTNYNLAGCQ